MSVKIVICDDDRVTLTLLEKSLADHGLQVFAAQDGAEAFELVQNEKPTILISDMLIPKIHGIDLCQKIKADDSLKKTSVILMTAVYKFIAFKDEIKSSGANYFIKKPIAMKKLLALVDEIISKQK